MTWDGYSIRQCNCWNKILTQVGARKDLSTSGGASSFGRSTSKTFNYASGNWRTSNPP